MNRVTSHREVTARVNSSRMTGVVGMVASDDDYILVIQPRQDPNLIKPSTIQATPEL